MVNSPSNYLERKPRSIWGVFVYACVRECVCTYAAFFIALLDVERAENIFETIHFLISQKNLSTLVILGGI